MKLFDLKLTDKQVRNFWRKVEILGEDDCWEWQASKHIVWHYGHFNVNREILKAHRVSYFIHNGIFDDSLKVCHSCDNPSCVNPKHLFLGTDLDNNRDMIKKGRNKQPRGERNGSAKLTKLQVIEIRNLYATKEYSYNDLAKMFTVDKSNIALIIKRKHWKHV